jgi:hypothetical protein
MYIQLYSIYMSFTNKKIFLLTFCIGWKNKRRHCGKEPSPSNGGRGVLASLGGGKQGMCWFLVPLNLWPLSYCWGWGEEDCRQLKEGKEWGGGGGVNEHILNSLKSVILKAVNELVIKARWERKFPMELWSVIWKNISLLSKEDFWQA